jgi:phospholipid:diacylglycerol acyltransferase
VRLQLSGHRRRRQGGAAVWGDERGAPDDPPAASHSHGHFVAFRAAPNTTAAPSNTSAPVPDGLLARASAWAGLGPAPAPAGDDGAGAANMTAGAAGAWILARTPPAFRRMMAANYSTGLERSEAQLKRNDADPRAWTNPLEVQLPRAPGMKIYCVYGVGKETERSYWYARGAGADDDAVEDSADDAAEADGAPARPRARTSWIDAEYTDASARPPVVNGVKMGEGDGTVSLLSLGAMCVDGWQRPRYNPAGIKVVTVEVRAESVS